MQRLAGGIFGFAFAEHSTWLAITVYAYSRGGAREAGLMAAVQLLPATVLAPLLVRLVESLADAANRLRVGFAAQCVAMVSTAVAMQFGSWQSAYATAVVASIALTVTRPMIGAALPTVARNPRELVAANVIASTTEEVGRCVGPLVGGVLLALADPSAVFAAAAATTGIAAAIGRVGARPANDRIAGSGGEHGEPAHIVDTEFDEADDVGRPGVVAVLRSSAAVRWVIGVLSIAALAVGAIDVAGVFVAVDRLHMGEGVAGLLGGALGFGSIFGASMSGRLVGGARVRLSLLLAGVACGGSFAVIGLSTRLPLTVLGFATAGAAQALIVMTANVMMQRRAPTETLGRLFGVAEGVNLLFLAAGSFAIASMTDAWATPTAFVVFGAALLLLVAGGAIRLAILGALAAPPPADVYDRIAADPLFEPLGVPALERLAVVADEMVVPAGTAIISEGESGDRYFLLLSGHVQVEAAAVRMRQMTKGESFGELALLQDVPRTATVTAVDEVRMLSIDSDEFLLAVTGHPLSRRRATTTANRYLAGM